LIAALLTTLADEVADAVHQLQLPWAVAKYQTPQNNKKVAFKSLVDRAAALNTRHTQRAVL